MLLVFLLSLALCSLSEELQVVNFGIWPSLVGDPFAYGSFSCCSEPCFSSPPVVRCINGQHVTHMLFGALWPPLSGTIGGGFEDLQGLRKLDLSGNELHGEVAEDFYFGRNLTYLRLDHNHLTGRLFQVKQYFEYFDVSNNYWRDEIYLPVGHFGECKVFELGSPSEHSCFFCPPIELDAACNDTAPEQGICDPEWLTGDECNQTLNAGSFSPSVAPTPAPSAYPTPPPSATASPTPPSSPSSSPSPLPSSSPSAPPSTVAPPSTQPSSSSPTAQPSNTAAPSPPPPSSSSADDGLSTTSFLLLLLVIVAALLLTLACLCLCGLRRAHRRTQQQQQRGASRRSRADSESTRASSYTSGSAPSLAASFAATNPLSSDTNHYELMAPHRRQPLVGAYVYGGDLVDGGGGGGKRRSKHGSSRTSRRASRQLTSRPQYGYAQPTQVFSYGQL